MEMTLDAILEAYNAHGRVWETQERVRDYIRDHSLYSFQDRIESVMANYALMLDYLERGFKDDKRDRFYQEAVAETYRLIQDLRIADRKKTNPSYKVAAAHAATVNMDQAEIRNRLEGFVADQAMLALEPDSVRQERHRALYERHTDYVSRLFDSIFVSSQWSEAEMGFYLDLLSSPTVDILDVQVLVSAVTLSCVNVFDPRKQQLLCDLFLASADEHVRQRALVGWAFSLRWDEKMMLDRQRRSALKLMAHDTGCRQLMELQKQMVYCVNAEADNRKIQRDIMPTLLNNSHLQITKFGIAEKEEDSLRDILHPDADEKAMDEVEATIAKMREMEKSGSDIYFGGFRHMKRYAFFYTLSNWFVPFFTEILSESIPATMSFWAMSSLAVLSATATSIVLPLLFRKSSTASLITSRRCCGAGRWVWSWYPRVSSRVLPTSAACIYRIFIASSNSIRARETSPILSSLLAMRANRMSLWALATFSEAHRWGCGISIFYASCPSLVQPTHWAAVVR